MQLVIAEKPSVARAIAKVIGAYKQEDGYLLKPDILQRHKLQWFLNWMEKTNS